VLSTFGGMNRCECCAEVKTCAGIKEQGKGRNP